MQKIRWERINQNQGDIKEKPDGNISSGNQLKNINESLKGRTLHGLKSQPRNKDSH